MIPRAIDRFLLDRLPPTISMHYRAYKIWRWGEPEIRALPALCDRGRMSIDVGAHWGCYSYFIRRFSKRCVAIEPNPNARKGLRRNLGANFEVLPYALSEHDMGKAVLRIPRIDAQIDVGLGTIEPSNMFSEVVEQIEVETRSLDSFNFRNVGFVKIDAEGHELSILRGARTILQSNANFMIEIEDRHRPDAINSTFGLMRDYSYEGYFILSGCIMPVRHFSLEMHQRLAKIGSSSYVNNFIFVKQSATAEKLHRAFARRICIA